MRGAEPPSSFQFFPSRSAHLSALFPSTLDAGAIDPALEIKMLTAVLNSLRHLFPFVLLLAAASPVSSQGGSLHGVDPVFADQLTAELRSAPAPVLAELKNNDAKLREFIAGRIHDERVAKEARLRGLDARPDVRAAIGSFTRDTLAKALFLDFQEAERKKLPALDALARQYYMANKDEYVTPEAIRVAHILVAVDVERLSEEEIAERRTRADALLARIRAGEDFSALAREHSEDKGSAANGGELPRPVPKDALVPPFERAAWALKPGETSEVVRTRFGYHIIRLLEVVPKGVRPFDEVRSQIVEKLQNDLLNPRRAAFVDSFRDASLEAEADALLPDARAALNADGGAVTPAPAK